MESGENQPISPGLYLGYFKFTQKGSLCNILVYKDNVSMIPHVKIRDDVEVSKNRSIMAKKFHIKTSCI